MIYLQTLGTCRADLAQQAAASQEMVSKDFGTTLPWNYHPEAGARIGLLPKYAKDASQLRWFDLPMAASAPSIQPTPGRRGLWCTSSSLLSTTYVHCPHPDPQWACLLI